ncbi:hypothetical protein GEMRC1_007465 [Eukaryota sp. GEM-RC1]
MIDVTPYVNLSTISSSVDFSLQQCAIQRNEFHAQPFLKKSLYDQTCRNVFFDRVSLTPDDWRSSISIPRVIGCIPNAVIITRVLSQGGDHYTCVQLAQAVTKKPLRIIKTLFLHKGLSFIVSSSVSPQLDLLAFTIAFPVSSDSVGYDAFLAETNLLP